MASVIAVPAVSLLGKVGAGVAGAVGKWIFGKGLAVAVGQTDTEKIRQDIAGVIAQVHQIQVSVDALSHQLSDSLLQLRQDDLKSSITKINTYYDTIGDIVQTAFELPSQNLTTEEQNKEAGKLQKRLDDRLASCANEIPGILDRIDDFLGETGSESFLHQTAQHAFDDSMDFLAYYSKSKVMVLGYWVAVVKGISLLQMAHESQNVDFPEGQHTIDRSTQKYLSQEINFRDTIGNATINLALELLKDTSAEVHINWKNSKGLWMEGGTGWYYYDAVSTTFSHLMDWFMLPHPNNPGSDHVDPIVGYRAKMRQVRNQLGWLAVAASQYQVIMTAQESLSSWYIKPLAPGSDKFSFRFQSNYVNADMDGLYIVRTDENLHYRDQLDINDVDMGFTVVPQSLDST